MSDNNECGILWRVFSALISIAFRITVWRNEGSFEICSFIASYIRFKTLGTATIIVGCIAWISSIRYLTGPLAKATRAPIHPTAHISTPSL